MENNSYYNEKYGDFMSSVMDAPLFPTIVMNEEEAEDAKKRVNDIAEEIQRKIWFENMLRTIAVVRKDCDKMEKEILELQEENDDDMMDEYLEKNHNHYLTEVNRRIQLSEILKFYKKALTEFPNRYKTVMKEYSDINE